MKTTDLCDAHPQKIKVAEPIGFKSFGTHHSFFGRIATVKCFDDNSFVRKALETDGQGRVLVVDGAGSMRCALLGDMLADLAIKNGWSGIIVNGCIRDSAAINEMSIGVKALNTMPLKSEKRNEGQTEVAVEFAGINFVPGHWVYADEDGIIVSAEMLI